MDSYPWLHSAFRASWDKYLGLCVKVKMTMIIPIYGRLEYKMTGANRSHKLSLLCGALAIQSRAWLVLYKLSTTTLPISSSQPEMQRLLRISNVHNISFLTIFKGRDRVSEIQTLGHKMAHGCADFKPTFSHAQLPQCHNCVCKGSFLHSSRELLSLCMLDLP